MIINFYGLEKELGGLFTVGSLRVMDCRKRLPFTRHWIEGQRAFDPVEVEAFKAETLARRQSVGKAQ